MEDKIVSALTQTPAILALLLMLWGVRGYLSKRDAEQINQSKQFTDTLKDRDAVFLSSLGELNHENLQAREQSRMVIERNTIEATNNTNALREMTSAVKDLIRPSRA